MAIHQEQAFILWEDFSYSFNGNRVRPVFQYMIRRGRLHSQQEFKIFALLQGALKLSGPIARMQALQRLLEGNLLGPDQRPATALFTDMVKVAGKTGGTPTTWVGHW